ncbi:MAG: CCA tRNA nucleotidyltransferase [Clostridiales bacterium]|nr:CCA tRNA nucleotidyltransferase [Clostridiales bacterium]
MNINIPEYVKEVLKRLHDGGYEAYVVGGCVRDSILGLMPDDWDVCTEAEPDEMKDCFIGLRSVDTGIQHGTVTAVSEGRPVEVTTYRIDGAYSDGRHPDAVTFTRSLREDLARRDFTINAMAYDPGKGLIDPFGGSEDLKRGLIRCVGDPNTRFSEDALRILRALRFSSKLGFRIEPETGRAVREMAETVKLVARERVGAEFVKLVLGKGASGVMVGFREALNASGIALMAEDESLRSVDALPRSLPVRLAVIFQDAAGQALKDLRLDRHTIASCLRIQEALCEDVPKDRVQLKLQMMQFGEDAERAMLEIRRVCARGDRALQEAERALDMLQAVLDRKEVWNLKQLQVSGKDLLQAGIPQGKLIGSALHHLLVLVIEGKLENKEEKLTETAYSLFCSGNL